VIYAVADELLAGGVVDVGVVVVGGVVVGVGGGLCVCVGVGVGAGELLGDGSGVGDGEDAAGLLRTGEVVGALFFVCCTAVRLLVALPLSWPGAEPATDRAGLVVESAFDAPVLGDRGPELPADPPGSGVLPAVCIVPGDAAE
jgi:hypothetical protein